jgi:predicted RNase H-like HicB family nuclease
MPDKFSVFILWSNEDDGYIAISLELEGLSAFGETKADALRELDSAISRYMAVLEEDGIRFPDPVTLENIANER